MVAEMALLKHAANIKKVQLFLSDGKVRPFTYHIMLKENTGTLIRHLTYI